MSVLHRYALDELLRMFLLALVAFTAIFLVAGVVREAIQRGLNPIQILGLMPLVVPGTLPYTIPSSVLLAVTIVYGRMAQDNEIMAAKAAGINVLYLMVPAIGLGLLLSVITLGLCNYLIPTANYRLRAAFVKNMEDVIYNVLRTERVLRGHNIPYEIYVQEVQGRTLINTTFKQRDSSGNYARIMHAEKASLQVDMELKQIRLQMVNAQAHGNGIIVVIEDEEITIPLPDMDRAQKRPRDMTSREIRERRRQLKAEFEASAMRCAFQTSLNVAKGRFREGRWLAFREADQARFWSQRTLWRLAAEVPLRSAIAFGCLSFVLLGCPVAILFQRGDYLSAFFSCFLPIIALYYPLTMLGLNLSKEGYVAPVILWSGDAFLIVLSIFPMNRVLQH